MKRWLPILWLAAALLSLADRSGLAWAFLRPLGFLVLLLHVPAMPVLLWTGIAMGILVPLWGGWPGLDWALAGLVYLTMRPRLRDLALLCASVGCLGAIAYWSSPLHPQSFPLLFPFHNRNHHAVLVEIALPLLLYQARKGRQNLWLVSAGLMLFNSLAAGSRTGAALLALEVLALGAIVWGRRSFSFTAPAAVALASFFLLLQPAERIRNPLAGDHRLEIWFSSLDMIAARPWLGWGGGNFQQVYPQFARFDNGQIVNAAHSDWLEWLTEYGVLAGLLPLLFLILWLKRNRHFYPAWGILIGALHAAVDYPFHLPGLLVFTAALAGSIERHGTKRQTQSSNPQG